MKKIILSATITIILSGCTQMITAPIKIAGAAVGATIDVAGSTVHAVRGGHDED